MNILEQSLLMKSTYIHVILSKAKIVGFFSQTPSRTEQVDFSDPQNWQKPVGVVGDAIGGSQDDGEEAVDDNFGELGGDG